MIALNSSIAVPLDENCVTHEYEELRSEVDFLVVDRDLISESKIEKDFGENFEYMEDLLFDIERIDISDVVEKDKTIRMFEQFYLPLEQQEKGNKPFLIHSLKIFKNPSIYKVLWINQSISLINLQTPYHV